MKKIALIICVSMLITILFAGCLKRIPPLQYEIMKYIDNQNSSEGVVSLSTFTDFAWEKVIIYEHPLSKKEIEEAAGMLLEIDFDVSSGMIFINQDRIVYEEIFPEDYDHGTLFMISPHRIYNPDSRFIVLTKEEAVFQYVKEPYNETIHYDYRLFPKE